MLPERFFMFPQLREMGAAGESAEVAVKHKKHPLAGIVAEAVLNVRAVFKAKRV
jgi:hypothetical protein